MSPYSDLPCWVIMTCAQDKKCPAKETPHQNCWDIFSEVDQKAFHVCRDCIVYLSRQEFSSLSRREMEQIMISKGIDVSGDGRIARFTVPGPMHLDIEFDGNLRRPLFRFLEPTGEENPESDGKLTVFRSGEIHGIGVHEPADGETVWIEKGAVVRGAFLAEGKRDVAIRGLGIVDGRFPPSIIQGWDREHLVHNLRFENLVVHGKKIRDLNEPRMVTEFWRNAGFYGRRKRGLYPPAQRDLLTPDERGTQVSGGDTVFRSRETESGQSGDERTGCGGGR